MKIRITGTPEQVRAMVDNMKEYCGLEINYISNRKDDKRVQSAKSDRNRRYVRKK